jgi:hypothetical protein
MTNTEIIKYFDLLQQAIIDTSTLIYLDSIGLLECASRCIHLMTIPEVQKEFGDKPGFAHIEVVETGERIDNKTDSADELIVKAAIQMNLPVLSEDKGVLMNARKKGLKYYNTLMILNFLLYRGEVQPVGYDRYLKKLKRVAHYGKGIYEVGRILHEDILIIKRFSNDVAGI